MKKIFLTLFFCLHGLLFANDCQLRWSADPESGAPNVFYQDCDLTHVIGFEADIINHISNKIGRIAEFCPNEWDGLIPGLYRNLCDVVINGITAGEYTNSDILFSKPYYACNLALVVRSSDDKITSILDCNDTKIGVLKNSNSQSILSKNLKSVEVIGYPTEYFALSDVVNGRINGALLDGQIAQYYMQHFQELRIIDTVGELKYSIVTHKKNHDLLEKINQAIDEMYNDGSLNVIIQKWGINNPAFEKMLSKQNHAHQTISDVITSPEQTSIYKDMLPSFVKATGVTIVISLLSMILAMILGLGLAIVKMYTPCWLSMIAVGIIEFLRGTPLLIQLLFIFYGLPCIGITLSPLVAGILALGVNYAAYEAENFRAGMLAVPFGQMEAARALGMNHLQSLKHVILPQAFSFILPPLTNDFISLLKDSSLVSLITIVELTKAYTLSASNTFNFFGTGLIVAIIYFMIGFPFVRLAKIAENHLKLEKRAYHSRRVKR